VVHVAWLGKKTPFCGNVTYGNSTTKVHYNFLNWKVSKALDD